ncbi:MAG: hypothetical protein CR974_00910 [Gammaproteobacteria bacterium]|nr:MAG: hypothetical protein CR974_00910 [Gammaproteobacteria bacterium]
MTTAILLFHPITKRNRMKNSNKNLSLLAVSAPLLFLFGCGNDLEKQVAGSWTCESTVQEKDTRIKTKSDVEYAQDGTLSMETELDIGFPPNFRKQLKLPKSIVVKVQGSGNWTVVDDNTIDETAVIQVVSMSPNLPVLKRFVDKMDGQDASRKLKIESIDEHNMTAIHLGKNSTENCSKN